VSVFLSVSLLSKILTVLCETEALLEMSRRRNPRSVFPYPLRYAFPLQSVALRSTAMTEVTGECERRFGGLSRRFLFCFCYANLTWQVHGRKTLKALHVSRIRRETWSAATTTTNTTISTTVLRQICQSVLALRSIFLWFASPQACFNLHPH